MKFGQWLLVFMIIILAVIIVFIVLPGKKNPIYPHPTPRPTASVTSRVAKPGAFCPNPGAVGQAANGRTYTCTNGHWRETK